MAKTAQKAIAKWHKNWSMAKGEAIEDGASSIGARSSERSEAEADAEGRRLMTSTVREKPPTLETWPEGKK